MTRRAVAVLVAVSLAACGGPFIGPTAGMGWRWRSEPTVATDSPALEQPLEVALERWAYGLRRSDCSDAAICVVAGTQSHAGPVGERCVAEVASIEWEIVAHELGHCFGLPHSPDPSSVLFWYSRPGAQDVTDADRRAARSGPVYYGETR